jgi:futalosine hydrolase
VIAARTLVVVAVEAERRALGERCLLSPHVTVVVAGIGRTNAAAAVAESVARGQAEGRPFTAVVGVGIAGALPGSGVSIGDRVVASECVYVEEGIELPEGFAGMDALGFALGDFAGNRVPVDAALLGSFAALGRTGPVATVATCSGTDRAAAEVVRRTGALCEAMEGAAVVHAARRAGVPAIEIRAISNTTGERARQEWRVQDALSALAAVGDAMVTATAPHPPGASTAGRPRQA